MSGHAGEGWVRDGDAFFDVFSVMKAQRVSQVPTAAAHEGERGVTEKHRAEIQKAGQVLRSNEDGAPGLEHTQNLLGEKPGIVEMFDYLGAMDNVKGVIRIGPHAIEVHRQHLEAALLSLGFERRGGLDAAEEFRLIIEVTKEK